MTIDTTSCEEHLDHASAFITQTGIGFLESMEVRSKIGATRLVGQGGGQEDDGFEAMAQSLGEAGHFFGITRRLIATIELAVPCLGSFGLLVPSPEPGSIRSSRC